MGSCILNVHIVIVNAESQEKYLNGSDDALLDGSKSPLTSWQTFSVSSCMAACRSLLLGGGRHSIEEVQAAAAWVGSGGGGADTPRLHEGQQQEMPQLRAPLLALACSHPPAAGVTPQSPHRREVRFSWERCTHRWRHLRSPLVCKQTEL